MKHVPAAEANRQFSRLLREVRNGETVVITSHGAPVARIVPCDSVEGDLDEAARRQARKHLWKRLRSQPVQNLGKVTRDEIYEETL